MKICECAIESKGNTLELAKVEKLDKNCSEIKNRDFLPLYKLEIEFLHQTWNIASLESAKHSGQVKIEIGLFW